MNWAIELIEKHKPRSNEANIFGIIIFTDAHPHIKKALNDNDYWASLDEWSGEQWAVFATRVAKGSVGFPSFPDGCIGYMVPVWKEPRSNKQLLDLFEITSTEHLPLLIVFTKTEDGIVLKNEIAIDEESTEAAYKSLKDSLRNISEALKDIDPSNLKNPLGVHGAVSLSVQNMKDWQCLKNGIKVWQWLKSIV